ncbi:hypothetical protein N7527_006541 [Penicillium freii]|uniref:Peptidase A2 domain-containing protein n=1 Tax=Penicillium freii TaxID=48697 RepID=A0A124GR63_PENFR|nr:hypothetical protein N7527_006541 [Penicillium freii]KUM60248.1 hypothetical protein ACN42_g6865 [Penicillium freii]
MELLEKFPPGMVLSRVAEDLNNHHGHLRVALSTSHVAYKEVLTATLNCVRELPGRILLPTTNPVRRALLKKMALESQDSLKDPAPFSSIRLIRTTGQLNPEDFPPPASPNRRALLKKYHDENIPSLREPYILNLPTLRTENTLTAIVGNAMVTPLEWGPGLPECKLSAVEMLWDTGAYISIITRDLLNEEFQAHLSDPINEPCGLGTCVQVSFKVEFSNSLFHMDIIAVVVEPDTIPNLRSGIMLGQRGCIDALQYRSISRSIFLAKGDPIDERY